MKYSDDLKRELGLPAAIAIVVGTTIGSGIFLVPRSMAAHLGSPALVMTVWVMGGLLSLFGTLTYAGLATRFPKAGGEFVYLREIYGPFWAFTYGWVQTWVSRSGAMATLATGFFAYLAFFVPELERTLFTVPLPIGPGWRPLEIRSGQILAIVVITILGYLNARGVQAGSRFQVVTTTLKVALIVCVIGAGLLLPGGQAANFTSQTPPITEGSFFLRFFAALVASLWAYDGWNTIAMVGSEVKDPDRNLPRALIGGMGLIIAIYLLANVAYFYVLPVHDVAHSSGRVAADMMQKVTGPVGGAFVSIAAMISIVAALNGTLLGGSRIPFAMSRDGLLFSSVGEIHPTNHTPAKAIWLITAVSCVMVLSGRYEELFTSVIFSSWVLYGMTAAGIFVLRKREMGKSTNSGVLGYPWAPGLFVFTATLLLIATLIQSPRESLIGLVAIAIGVPFYAKKQRENSDQSKV